MHCRALDGASNEGREGVYMYEGRHMSHGGVIWVKELRQYTCTYMCTVKRGFVVNVLSGVQNHK